MRDLEHDLESASTPELLQLHARVEEELRRRQVEVGATTDWQLAERLTLEVYGGTLTSPGTADVDVVDRDLRRIQVKSRTLPAGEHRTFQFERLVFDLAVCIRFDRETGALEWAREFTVDELIELTSPHKSGPRLPTGRAEKNGTDVTALFTAAFAALAGSSD